MLYEVAPELAAQIRVAFRLPELAVTPVGAAGSLVAGAGPKNIPEMGAQCPAVDVIVIVTLPLTLQTWYTPPWKFAAERVSRTVPVAVSLIVIVSAYPAFG